MNATTTHISQPPAGQPEQRSEILAELRQTLDALGETCSHHQTTRTTLSKLLDMMAPGKQTDLLREKFEANMQTLDALSDIQTRVLNQVRSGLYKNFAEAFDR